VFCGLVVLIIPEYGETARTSSQTGRAPDCPVQAPFATLPAHRPASHHVNTVLAPMLTPAVRPAAGLHRRRSLGRMLGANLCSARFAEVQCHALQCGSLQDLRIEEVSVGHR
jgi:hypothetical protein